MAAISWSLKLRYWAWKHDDYPYADDIRIFVRYFDPETTPEVAHSLGLQKGLIGVVNAFAWKDMHQQNNMVITDELLHTVGAVDKYDRRNNMPIYPVGYADPDKQPLYPQKRADIMVGRIPVGPALIKQPCSLSETEIGKATAQEIRWTQF